MTDETSRGYEPKDPSTMGMSSAQRLEQERRREGSVSVTGYLAAVCEEMGIGHIGRRLEPNRLGHPMVGSLRNLSLSDVFTFMVAVEATAIALQGEVDWRPQLGITFIHQVCDPFSIPGIRPERWIDDAKEGRLFSDA